MAREEESKDVDTCGDPAVVRILRITAIHYVVKILQRGKLLLSQREILHQRYTPNIEENSHEKLKTKRKKFTLGCSKGLLCVKEENDCIISLLPIGICPKQTILDRTKRI